MDPGHRNLCIPRVVHAAVLAMRIKLCNVVLIAIVACTLRSHARTLPDSNSPYHAVVAATTSHSKVANQLPDTLTWTRLSTKTVSFNAAAARSLLKASSGGSKSSTTSKGSSSTGGTYFYTSGSTSGSFGGLQLWARILIIVVLCLIGVLLIVAFFRYCFKCTPLIQRLKGAASASVEPVGQGSYYTYGANATDQHQQPSYPPMPALGQPTAVGIPVQYTGATYPPPAALAPGSQPALRSLQASRSSKSFK